MPSPVGHSLAAIAVGWAVNRPAGPRRALVAQTATLAAIGIAPDLDLLWGHHEAQTHSVGAALVVAAIVAWRRWPIGADTRARLFVAAFLVYLIHPVMDAFAIDNNPPIGVMLWWPFSHAYVHSSHAFFAPISRYWSRPETWPNNFMAAAHEILWLAPFVALAWFARTLKRQRGKGPKRQ